MVAARVLATAFVKEGKFAMAFPKYGVERRGAPVAAFNRFDDEVITEKTQVYYPDCLIVIDPQLMKSVNVFEGLNPEGILVIDAAEPTTEPYHQNLSVAGFVDATGIGLEEIGRRITNTPMLGAFARTTGWVKLDSILDSLAEYFSGSVLSRNIKSVQRGYEETKVVNY